MSTLTQNVVISDNIPPAAVCNDITVTLDNNGSYTLTEANQLAISSGSSDNCSNNLTTAFSETSFGCENIPVRSGDLTLEFDGINDYITMGDVTATDFGTTDFTIEFLVKTDQSPLNEEAALISKRGDCNDGNFWNIRLETDGTIYYEHSAGPGSGQYAFIRSNISINDNQWNHVAVVRGRKYDQDIY